MPLQHFRFVREPVRLGGEVGVLRVFGGDLQRHLLSATRDPQRNTGCLQRPGLHDGTVDLVVLAVEAHHAVAPGGAHDLHAFIKPGQPHAGRREAVTVCAPFVFVPAAADSHLDPASGDDVGRRSDFREIRRIAVADRGTHLAQLDSRGGRGVRRHQRPRLVRGLRGRHRHSVEVVVDPQRIPRAAVGIRGEVAHHLPLVRWGDPHQIESPTLRDEQSEAHAPTLGRLGARVLAPRRQSASVTTGCRT
ncbi:hypothetical protein MAUB1S_03115 [Mycolicibacterium aubagnense]